MKKEGNMTSPKNGVLGMFFVRKMQWMTENPDHNSWSGFTRILV